MEIRGIWLTTTASQVFNSRRNIAEAMDFLAETGFNVVFPVVWNNGLTTYPSRVMQNNFGVTINPRFQGRDPLAEIISEAKRVNLAVIPWFEYGFASSFQKKGGAIIEKKPEWAAQDVAGNLVTKNGFDWLNALDSEVQDFLLSLFVEVVKNYEIAGIQGDDRFPALPSEGGYDHKTIARYSQKFNQKPPDNFRDPLWLQWRADILSDFLNRLYREIISINPNLIISMSPSPYPWSYENYLQDSQTWIDLGLVDLIHPQLYQREFNLYQRDVDRVLAQQFSQEQLPQLIPGVLLKVGTYTISPEHLIQALKYNRSVGIQGEILFFYEGLRENNNALANVLKSSVYSQSPGKFDQKEIKKNTFTHRRVNGDYTYINTSREIKLKVKYDWASPFSEGMAAVKMGYKWSYIDKTGKLITNRMEFDSAEPFSEGIALVKLKNKYRYIDKMGKFISSGEFDDATSFSSGLASVKIADKWGYINQQGIIPISPQFEATKLFAENLAAVKVANKWGYIDREGKINIQFLFDDAGNFFEGLALVKVGNKCGYIDKIGKFVIEPKFDDAGNFSEGLAFVKVGNKCGYIDKIGKFVIEPKFDDAGNFSEGLAPAKVGNKWGYINQFAQFIIPTSFDFAQPFAEGIALVNVGGAVQEDTQQGKVYFTGGKWGYIRKP